MKKIFATLLATSMMLMGVQAYAQISVGAGYVNSTQTTKAGNSKTSSDANGFYAGGSYNLSIAGGLGLAPGLYYEFLSSSSDEAGIAGIATVKGTTTEHYLNVPVMLTYGLELMPDCTLFAYAGPTISYGVASTTKVSADTAIGSGSKSTSNYGDNSAYKPFDVMLGGGVGFNINSFQVKVGYNQGMLNRYDSDNVTLHRGEVHLGVAYMF